MESTLSWMVNLVLLGLWSAGSLKCVSAFNSEKFAVGVR